MTDDVLDDVLGIAAHTADERGAQRVEKQKTNKVETGTGLDNASIVNGEPVANGERQIEQVIIRPESSAPDNVRDVEDRSILENRIPVPASGHARYSFDTRSGKILSSYPSERNPTRGIDEVVAELSS
jgi:hypothetical protein